jgi:hypothetical protein
VDFITYLGGTGDDIGRDLVIGEADDIFVIGDTTTTTQADFPIVGGVQTTNAGSTDAFVAVLNATGSALDYSTYLGGSEAEHGFGIAMDVSGIIYVTGETFSDDFPFTSGNLQPNSAGGMDAFIVKLDTGADPGSQILYSTYFGGSSDDSAHDVKVDDSGQAYIAGVSSSNDFPVFPDPDVFQISNAGGSDAFVTKLNSDGSSTIYSTYLGGDQNDAAISLVLDSLGNAFVTGYTYSNNFPTEGSAVQPLLGGADDAFVALLSVSGDSLLYSTFLGGSGSDVGRDLNLDYLGSLYVTGETGSIDFPVAGYAIQSNLRGSRDAFLIKFNDDGSDLAFSSYLGGDADDSSYGIAVYDLGQVFITGGTNSSDFPTTTNAFQPNHANANFYDAFVVEIGGLLADSISGKVTTSGTGEPVQDVEVYAFNDEMFIEGWGFTDANGFYQISDLPAGCYDVQVYPDEFADYQISDQKHISTTAGEIRPSVDFTLEPAGHDLIINVTYGVNPVVGAQVGYGHEPNEVYQQSLTEAGGQYTFYNVPAGTVHVWARDDANDRAFTGTDVEIPNIPGQTTVNLELIDESCISGRVVDENDVGMSGVWVNFDSELHNSGSGTTTNGSGSNRAPLPTSAPSSSNLAPSWKAE